MSDVAVVAEASTRTKPTILPSIGALVKVAAVPCAVLIALTLATGHAFIGAGIAGGLLVALVMYAGIHSFVTGASSLALSSVGGRADSKSGSFMPVFALVAVGKFIALGALLYVLFRIAHIGLAAFAVGFLVSQIAITLQCIKSLMNNPLIEKSAQTKH